jgi:chromosome segregation ATPase
MPEEKRLIAELVDRDNERIAAQSALTYPKYSISPEEFQQLAMATELARGKVAAVRVRLRSIRAAKGRKKDSHDLHKLQNALNELSEEIDTISYASEAAKEQLPSSEANEAYRERHRRLETIREKLANLTLAMASVDGKPLGNAQSDVGEALQKLQSAQTNLVDVETHLNKAEGADANDQHEIASAKISASDVEDDLNAVFGKITSARTDLIVSHLLAFAQRRLCAAAILAGLCADIFRRLRVGLVYAPAKAVSAAFKRDNCLSTRSRSCFNCFFIEDRFAIESPSGLAGSLACRKSGMSLAS